VRVRKFCANTQASSALLDATGFVRPYTIEQGLARTIAATLDSAARASSI